MAAWTEERKAEAIAAYLAEDPTAENSVEICKQIAEDMGESPNGVRMILVQAGKYVRKDSTATAAATSGTTKAAGEGTKRVSKEVSLAALTKVISDAGATVDSEIIEKLTGKGAIYFTSVIKHILDAKE
jgi:hypothetical protein